ncbi:ABC transporter substrate-binding protein [Actinopolymorpha sp. B17G11]|uniref:ABC transporter substrate-binding protein n=1 Tax=Actinopolymorpha sp. B17G11 TaxID=3160861 RepID=UPI0032E393F8
MIRNSQEFPRRLSRRDALGLAGGLALTSVAVAGCDLLSTDPGGSDAGSNAGAAKGKQAPSLEKLVKAGDLPPLSSRLPKNPLVVNPIDEVGRYGGTWHSYLDGLAAVGYKFYVELGYDPLVSWAPDWSDLIPNLAEGWEVENGGQAYLFKLRQGVKWSDGEPFTADDLTFMFEDVWGNKEISPIPPEMFSTDGKLATLEKIDDHTVRFVFGAPNALFLRRLATPSANSLITPRHYMEKFHVDYNPDTEAAAKDEGFSDWIDYFWDRNTTTSNPDRPSLNAWVLTTAVDDSSGRGVFERNPYYWKVDPDGSQLPYIDRVTYEIMDLEVVLLRTTSGDLDFNAPALTGGVATLDNKPVLARGREKGEYEFIDGVPGSMNQGVISLNLNTKNAALREVFQNRDFRIGLSYAINRQEIVNAVYQRQGEPWQAAPRKESEFFNEELAKQFTDYDVDQANSYLDRAGYSRRDGDGTRLGPDGKRIAFSLEVVTNEPNQISAMDLVTGYWREVGVEMQVKTEDRTLFYDRKAANLHDASVWTGDGGLFDADLDPRWYFPYSGESNYAPLWSTWYTSGGAEGEKPPAAAIEQMKLYDQFRATVDKAEARGLFNQILQIAIEQFWVIGLVSVDGTYGTVRRNFRNVPRKIPAAWLYPTPGPTRPEQYFVAD